MADVLSICGQLCSASDSRHAGRFTGLGLLELLKQRLLCELQHPQQTGRTAVNAAFTVANILAEPELALCHEVLRTRMLQDALAPLSGKS